MTYFAAFGGIYLDGDTIAVKSFDDMRVYELVMCREDIGKISNGIMVSIIDLFL